MSTLSILVPSVIAVGILLSLSAFFSSSESAIFSLPDEWIRTAASDGSPESLTLQALRADPHRPLVTILVGNNLVNIAISSIVTLLVARFVPPGVAVVLATLTVSVLILVFGEIVPKSYGLSHAQSWSLRVTPRLAHRTGTRPVGCPRANLPICYRFDCSVLFLWLTSRSDLYYLPVEILRIR